MALCNEIHDHLRLSGWPDKQARWGAIACRTWQAAQAVAGIKVSDAMRSIVLCFRASTDDQLVAEFHRAAEIEFLLSLRSVPEAMRDPMVHTMKMSDGSLRLKPLAEVRRDIQNAMADASGEEINTARRASESPALGSRDSLVRAYGEQAVKRMEARNGG